MAVLKLLACAVGRRRVAYVFLVGGRMKDWRVSEKAARSPQDAAAQTQSWINELKPDVLVTEKLDQACRKGRNTKAIIGAIERTAGFNELLDVSIRRDHPYANKYEEAEALADRYPEIKAWLPEKRRFFDHEPRNIVLFEALSLAESILRGPATTLAAAMG